jgi:hypothetical protein
MLFTTTMRQHLTPVRMVIIKKTELGVEVHGCNSRMAEGQRGGKTILSLRPAWATW